MDKEREEDAAPVVIFFTDLLGEGYPDECPEYNLLLVAYDTASYKRYGDAYPTPDYAQVIPLEA